MIIFSCLSLFFLGSMVGLHSCTTTYTEDNVGLIDSRLGFVFYFSDSTRISKIELMAVNKTIYFNTPSARVTLNPKDSISQFRIFTDSSSGVVEITYVPKVQYEDNKLTLNYQAKLKSTTFSNAFFLIFTGNPFVSYVQIIR